MRRLLAAAVFLLAVPAAADRPASRGPYAEIGLGATGFLGAMAGEAAIGPGAALRVGLDAFPFLSLGGRIELASHRATVPPPPEDQYVQLYQLAGDARLTARVGALALFADGGLGVAVVSTNVFDKVGVTEPGERATLAFAAGGGLEYQLMNRHYALGVAAQWSLLPGFEAAQAVAGRAFLRYTY